MPQHLGGSTLSRGGVSAKTVAIIAVTALLSVGAAHTAALAAAAGHSEQLKSHERRLLTVERQHEDMIRAVAELVGVLSQREQR